MVQVVQIGERGCKLDKIQNNSNFFFVKPSLIASVLFYSSIASHPDSLQCSHNSLHLPINECLVPKKQILFFSNNYCVQLLSWFSLYCLAPKYFDPSTAHVNDKSCHCQLLAILLHSTNIFFKIAQILQLIQSQILAALSHQVFLPRLVLFKPPHKCTSKCAGKSPAKANF